MTGAMRRKRLIDSTDHESTPYPLTWTNFPQGHKVLKQWEKESLPDASLLYVPNNLVTIK